MIKVLPRYIISFILLLTLQILVLNNIQLSGFINPYLYVLFILILPFETPKWMLLLLAFILGMVVDLFSHTPGMHTSATVFMAFLRPYVLEFFSPRDGYETETYPILRYYGLNWFLKYITILVLAHHLFLFYVEVFRFSDFFLTLGRALASSVFTIILVLISQYFYRK